MSQCGLRLAGLQLGFDVVHLDGYNVYVQCAAGLVLRLLRFSQFQLRHRH